MTKQSITKMLKDHEDSILNGDPNEELPSYDEVYTIFSKMYTTSNHLNYHLKSSFGMTTLRGLTATSLTTVRTILGLMEI